MATTYTDNLNLQQPDLDDDALITVINNDMEILDKAVNGVQDGLAIVANGNTHVAISAGQFVYVRNHTTLTEGLYVASSNIAANATLSTSNLTADSAGGLNALNSNLAKKDISSYLESSNVDSVGYAYEINGVVYIAVLTKSITLSANSTETITLVKAGKRPTFRVACAVQKVQDAGDLSPNANLETSGILYLTTGATPVSAKKYLVNIVYPL